MASSNYYILLVSPIAHFPFPKAAILYVTFEKLEIINGYAAKFGPIVRIAQPSNVHHSPCAAVGCLSLLVHCQS